MNKWLDAVTLFNQTIEALAATVARSTASSLCRRAPAVSCLSPLAHSSLPLSSMIVANAQLAQNTDTIISHRRECAGLLWGHPRCHHISPHCFYSSFRRSRGTSGSCMLPSPQIFYGKEGKNIDFRVLHRSTKLFLANIEAVFVILRGLFFLVYCYRLRIHENWKFWSR